MLFNQMLRGVLRDPNDGGNQGSGGASGGGELTLDSIRSLITETVNGAVNGLDKRYKKEFEALRKPGSPKTEEGEGEGGDDGATTKTKPQGVDPEVAKLRKQLEQMNKRQAEIDAERTREKQEALETKKDAALRRELAKSNFIDDEAFETAYARITREVKFAEDGQLVGGADDLPLSKYVADRMKKLDFLTKPRDVGGAGAANGGKQAAGDDVDIDSIKPGMAATDIAKVKARLASLYQN